MKGKTYGTVCHSVGRSRSDGYRLELTFADGLRGEVDLSGRILGRGGVFHALADPAIFRQVRVDPELGTIVWPNEADFCPDLLHAWVSCALCPLMNRS